MKELKFKLKLYAVLAILFSLSSVQISLAQTPASLTTPAEEKDFDKVNIPAGTNSKVDEVTLIPEVTPEEVVNQITAEENSRYTLGANDVLEVNVQRHPEVSGQYLINNEGKMQYEFVGDINVAGKTKDEVKVMLSEQLAKYIVSPEVTVKIIGYNSKVVYVIGEVARPGKIYMQGDTITVREALLEAGLPLLSASTKKSKLITPADNGDAAQKTVNVEALLYHGDLREDFVMKPGDTLYIPATVMAKAMRVISPVAQPIGTAAGTASTVQGAGFRRY